MYLKSSRVSNTEEGWRMPLCVLGTLHGEFKASYHPKAAPRVGTEGLELLQEGHVVV